MIRGKEGFRDYGIRMVPELAIPMTQVAIGLGSREGKVGPLSLDAVARRALRRVAEKEGIVLSPTRDDMASKHNADDLLEAATSERKVWVKYPADWESGTEALVAKSRVHMHLSQVWRSAIEEFSLALLKKWEREDRAVRVTAEVSAQVAAAS